MSQKVGTQPRNNKAFSSAQQGKRPAYLVLVGHECTPCELEMTAEELTPVLNPYNSRVSKYFVLFPAQLIEESRVTRDLGNE